MNVFVPIWAIYGFLAATSLLGIAAVLTLVASEMWEPRSGFLAALSFAGVTALIPAACMAALYCH